MIDRYSYPEMRALWAPENRYRKWLEVELLVAEGWAEIGRIPKEAATALRENSDRMLAPDFDFGKVVHRTLELEGDVPGFDAVFSIISHPMSLEDAMQAGRAKAMLAFSAEQILRLVAL